MINLDASMDNLFNHVSLNSNEFYKIAKKEYFSNENNSLNEKMKF